jgi:hypothetical protein
MFCSLLACAQTAALLQTGAGIYVLVSSLTAARATAANLSRHSGGRIGLLGLRVIAGKSFVVESALSQYYAVPMQDHAVPPIHNLRSTICRCGHRSSWFAVTGAC